MIKIQPSRVKGLHSYPLPDSPNPSCRHRQTQLCHDGPICHCLIVIERLPLSAVLVCNLSFHIHLR